MRINWIDCLKGFAIILVVIGHQNIPSYLSKYIFSFHMPLFFFISGYLFSVEKYITMKTSLFLKNKLKTLILPYFSFTLISYGFYIFFDLIHQPKVQNLNLFPNGLLYEVYKILYSGPSLLNYALWFLPCLFMTELIFYILFKKYYPQQNDIILAIIFLSIFGYIYSIYKPFRLPWDLDVALTSIVFYTSGYLFKINHEYLFYRKRNYLIFSFVIIHILLLSLFNESIIKIDMNLLQYGNYFIFYLVAFSGIITYIYIFKNIGSINFLEFYGKNSLIILGLHILIIGIFKHALSLLNWNKRLFEENIFMILIFTSATLLLLAPLILIINKYFPFLIGKTRVR